MAKGVYGSEGNDGLTLNYLTSPTVAALYKSLRAGHFPVVLGILGTLVLKLMVIFSTGLLTAKDQVMTSQIEFLALDKFNLYKTPSNPTSPLSYLRTLLAIRSNSLPYPSSTTPDFTTQPFLSLKQGKRKIRTHQLFQIYIAY